MVWPVRASSTILRTGETGRSGLRNRASGVSRFAESSRTPFTGHTIKTFAAVAPQILEKEGLDKKAAILLKTFETARWVIEVPPNTYEQRGLMMMVATPVARPRADRRAVIAGRLLNRTFDRSGLPESGSGQGTIFLGDVRIAQPIVVLRGENKGQIALGTLLDEGRTLASAGRTWFNGRRTINGERTMGAYEPLLDYDQKVIGAIYVGRPLAFIDSINGPRRRSKRTRRAGPTFILLPPPPSRC